VRFVSQLLTLCTQTETYWHSISQLEPQCNTSDLWARVSRELTHLTHLLPTYYWTGDAYLHLLIIVSRRSAGLDQKLMSILGISGILFVAGNQIDILCSDSSLLIWIDRLWSCIVGYEWQLACNISLALEISATHPQAAVFAAIWAGKASLTSALHSTTWPLLQRFHLGQT